MRIARLTASALLITACGLGVSACMSEEATSQVDPVPTTDTPAPSAAVMTEFQLRTGMRKLWTDHATWTRVFLIDAIDGLPDVRESTQRLLQNQVDIGNAVKPFYGAAAGEQLTTLLKLHITGAADVVDAAKSGDPMKFEKAKQAWYVNADAIAAFLATANPRWSLSELQTMMHTHLDQTLAEAAARLEHNWDADVKAYDQVVMHVLDMADALTYGIAKQFPHEVAGRETVIGQDQGLYLTTRKLWEDHVTWTRVFLMAAIADGADKPAATQRLLQNQADIGEALKPFYGDAAGDHLTALLEQHITLAASVVEAAQANDMPALGEAKAQWYANADAIAAFLAKANPNWSLPDLRRMMHTHLDQTLLEATSRLEAHWTADVKAYDAVVTHILSMADTLSDGIVKQFPPKQDE